MVIFKSKDEISRIHRASQIVAQTLETLGRHVQAGVSTLELDAVAESEIRKAGAIPAFKGYRGFPATLCVAVNEEIVHGIPSRKRLKEGDLISLDLGAIWQDFYGDAARTYAVGKIGEEARRLMDVTEKALMIGIEQARSGKRLVDIG